MNYLTRTIATGILAAAYGCGSGSSTNPKKLEAQDNLQDVDKTIDQFVADLANVQFVVGEQAPSSDVLGAITIASGMQGGALNPGTMTPFPIGSAKLDSEVKIAGETYRGNHIIVGSPEANTLVSPIIALMPAYTQPLPATGTGAIFAVELPNGNLDLLVTGRTSADVRTAADAVAQYATGQSVNLAGEVIYARRTANGSVTTEVIKP